MDNRYALQLFWQCVPPIILKWLLFKYGLTNERHRIDINKDAANRCFNAVPNVTLNMNFLQDIS